VSSAAKELTPLLEGLAEEARREADQIVGAARQRAEEALARAEREASRLEAEAEADGRREGEREARRRVALARIEARQDELRQRDAEVARAWVNIPRQSPAAPTRATPRAPPVARRLVARYTDGEERPVAARRPRKPTCARRPARNVNPTSTRKGNATSARLGRPTPSAWST